MRKPRRAAWETLSGNSPGPSPGLPPSPATCDTCHFPILGDGNATLPFAPGKTSRVPSDAGVFSSDPRSNWSPTRDLPSGKCVGIDLQPSFSTSAELLLRGGGGALPRWIVRCLATRDPLLTRKKGCKSCPVG
ncbi:hypothetical protein EGK_01205 [Macaca mulatta]|uniref:Uncharacterized protein n=1 Tax=Macaca mulatta TaxID=9544 RepID=G7MGE9_MACMU|nr:hypothetical protein EGK_01205 [Macaca mulatta]